MPPVQIRTSVGEKWMRDEQTPKDVCGEAKVNADIFTVYNWLIANELSLNIKKSYFVIFSPAQDNV